jgi:hypothetical protein
MGGRETGHEDPPAIGAAPFRLRALTIKEKEE